MTLSSGTIVTPEEPLEDKLGTIELLLEEAHAIACGILDELVEANEEVGA
jgi:hypothetical protein